MIDDLAVKRLRSMHTIDRNLIREALDLGLSLELVIVACNSNQLNTIVKAAKNELRQT